MAGALKNFFKGVWKGIKTVGKGIWNYALKPIAKLGLKNAGALATAATSLIPGASALAPVAGTVANTVGNAINNAWEKSENKNNNS